jgi:putative membrane protein
MVQHLLLTLVWPPLLIASMPGWLLRPVLTAKPGVLKLWRFLTRPLVAALIFTATIAFWHTIRFYDLMMRIHEVHVVTHLMFMGAAILLWWPVMSPVEEAPPLPMGMRMLYIFLASLPMQLVAALITFADDVLYPWYAGAPRTWGLNVEDDQLLGALLMWIPGNLYMFGAIALIFFLWARQEQAD